MVYAGLYTILLITMIIWEEMLLKLPAQELSQCRSMNKTTRFAIMVVYLNDVNWLLTMMVEDFWVVDTKVPGYCIGIAEVIPLLLDLEKLSSGENELNVGVHSYLL